jgi:hypothetical protein
MITNPIERIFAVLGTGICLLLTVFIWAQITDQQTVWPLPALYFLELMAVSVLASLGVWQGAENRLGLFAWAAAGLFLGFAIMGLWSVGFFYLPVALLFALAGLAADLRLKQNLAQHLGVGFLVGVAQAVLMLALIPLLG